jgi:multimeric flavodoxin WrbA
MEPGPSPRRMLARERENAKNVTVLVGSPHKGGATLAAARRFQDDLESFGDVDGEIVVLSDYNIGVCRGCKTCFARGEDYCPLKDDRDVLIAKMLAADGVVFASPNYSFQVSAVMKIFLDRLGFEFHRPCFHGKTSSSIVVFGIWGGGRVVKYLDFVGAALGFNVVKGSCVQTREPMDAKALQKMERTLAEQSRRFHDRLMGPAYVSPSLFKLWVFRMGRSAIERELSEDAADYRYYRDHGWFDSDYYYPVRLNPLKKAAGAVFDWTSARG